MILCVERLRDFLCLEWLCDFFHSLTHSGYMISDSGGCGIVLRRGCITFLWRGCVILFLESLHDFFVKRLHNFFWVDRLSDFLC